jgi:hypothetical protein
MFVWFSSLSKCNSNDLLSKSLTQNYEKPIILSTFNSSGVIADSIMILVKRGGRAKQVAVQIMRMPKAGVGTYWYLHLLPS